MRPSSKRSKVARVSPSAGPIPEDLVRPGVKYPPQGSIRPRHGIHTDIWHTTLDRSRHPSVDLGSSRRGMYTSLHNPLPYVFSSCLC